MEDREIIDSARHVWNTAKHELTRLHDGFDESVFLQCVKAISLCKGRIVTAGVGTSAAAARKIAHTLCCIERPSFFLSPGDGVHGALGAAQAGDLAILISKGGNTGEITRIIPALKTKGVYVVAVTENPDSTLGKAADLIINLKIEKEADTFNMLATTSTLLVIAYFDAVAISVMRYTGYTREQFAIIHPEGAVGDRLLKKD